jgi:hypothetical protein
MSIWNNCRIYILCQDTLAPTWWSNMICGNDLRCFTISWLIHAFHVSRVWSFLSNRTSSSATVLVYDAVKETGALWRWRLGESTERYELPPWLHFIWQFHISWSVGNTSTVNMVTFKLPCWMPKMKIIFLQLPNIMAVQDNICLS